MFYKRRYTWYVRDAQGNVLCTYGALADTSTALDDLFTGVGEVYLHGSSRIGSYTSGVSTRGPDGPGTVQYFNNFDYTRRLKTYELTNHLGNVLTTISDEKIAVPSSDSSLNVYFEPDILTANDYFPFGMLSRIATTPSGATYRYGFNGKEEDPEAKGEQNQLDYGMRIYDPRVGRFLSGDPITKQYPELTPYQFASNSPITFTDQDGLEMAYRLSNGRAYLPQASDHLRVPIPSNAVPIIPASGYKPSDFENEIVNFITPPLQALNTIVTGKVEKRKSVGTKTEQALGIGKTKLVTEKANAGDYVEAGLTIFLFGANFGGEGEGGGGGEGGVGGEMGGGETGELSAKQNLPVELGVSKTLPIQGDLPTRLVRVIPEEVAGNATNLAKPTDIDAFVTIPQELQGLTTSEQIAQKLSLYNPDGSVVKGPFRLIEFDTPAEGLATPIDRSNQGFVNGGKTGSGATEFVVPNFKLKELKNIKQTVIK